MRGRTLRRIAREICGGQSVDGKPSEWGNILLFSCIRPSNDKVIAKTSVRCRAKIYTLWDRYEHPWEYDGDPRYGKRIPKDTLSENNFHLLVRDDPQYLVDWIKSGTIPVHFLTFAAEAAGRIKKAELVIPVLEGLLDHESAYVREGAILGLSYCRERTSPELMEKIRQISVDDPSPGVREEAAYWLKNA